MAVLRSVPEVEEQASRERLVLRIMNLVMKREYSIVDGSRKKSDKERIRETKVLLESAKTEKEEMKLFDKVKYAKEESTLFDIAAALDTTRANEHMCKTLVSAIWQSENKASMDVLAWILARSKNKAAREGAAFGLIRHIRGNITRRNLEEHRYNQK